MEKQETARVDKDYIDHAIKFMERRALPDNDPCLERLNLEIVQVKLTCGFIISGHSAKISSSYNLYLLFFL